MDNGQFYKEMIGFKAKTEESLDNLCKDIKEMRAEREKHSTVFWEKFNKMVDSVQQESTTRLTEDSKLNTQIEVMKGKAGLIASVFALIVSAVISTAIIVVKWLLGDK